MVYKYFLEDLNLRIFNKDYSAQIVSEFKMYLLCFV